MAISSKRAYASLGKTESHNDCFKRRSLILQNPMSTQSDGSPRACVSNSNFQLHGGKTFNFFKARSSSDTLSESDSCSESDYVNFDGDGISQTPDAYIRLAQSRNTGSEIGPRRKSSSRPESFSSSSSRRAQVSKLDLNARERCFDYIVQSIDEVWARYCDTTSFAEAKVYGNLSSQKAARIQKICRGKTKTAAYVQNHKPLSITDRDTESESDSEINNPEGNHSIGDEDEESSGYKSEATNPTEYETDYGDSRTVSNLPDSVKLQSLKFRLTNAKNDMEQVYDSKEVEDSSSFWRRWDMIKYGAVEMMEEDDDDEIIENVIEELEQGRCYTN